MARPLRPLFPGGIYHVTARGNDRQAIFGDDADRSRFLIVLASVVARYRVRCHAYCLMGNHYHALLQTPEGNLSTAMRQLNGVYTQRFNRRHERSGHIFQGRYGAQLVDGHAHLHEVCRYVVLNPVRAGLVEHPRDWAWSSYRATAGETAPPGFLTVDWLRAVNWSRQPHDRRTQLRSVRRSGNRRGPRRGRRGRPDRTIIIRRRGDSSPPGPVVSRCRARHRDPAGPALRDPAFPRHAVRRRHHARRARRPSCGRRP